MHVFDQDDGGAICCELLKELGPRVVQPVARGERVELAGDVEAKGEPEVAIAAQPFEGHLRSICFL